MLLPGLSFNPVPLGYGPLVPATMANIDIPNSGGNYLSRSSALNGLSDGKQGTLSFWFTLDESDSGGRTIFEVNSGSSQRFAADRSVSLANNKFYITIRDSGGTDRMRVYTSSSISDPRGWTHIMASWDVTTSGRRHLYVNGTSNITQDAFSNATLYYQGSNIRMGNGSSSDANPLGGKIGDFFFHPQYLDLSLSANRAKFYQSGQPVWLGFEGERIFGSQAIWYMSGFDGEYAINKGSGGSFATVGSIGSGDSGLNYVV